MGTPEVFRGVQIAGCGTAGCRPVRAEGKRPLGCGLERALFGVVGRKAGVEGRALLVEALVELGDVAPLGAVLLGDVFGVEAPFEGADDAALPIDLVSQVVSGVERKGWQRRSL